MMHRMSGGSLTSRGMPLMPGLQHLGGKQIRAAAQRGRERRCVTRVGGGGVEQAAKSVKTEQEPVGEFLNSKTMLTKIMLTHTTKLNIENTVGLQTQ